MIFYNFQDKNDWFPWYIWLVLFSIVIYIVHYFDTHIIWEDEQLEFAKRNPILMEIHQMLEELIENEK